MSEQRKIFEEECTPMEKIVIDNKSREEARELVMGLERNKEFLVDTLTDGRRVYIKTDGKKVSKVNGEPLPEKKDITIHYDGETRPVNYVDDVLVDLIKKQVVIGNENIQILLKGIKDSIELTPITTVMKRYPEIRKLAKKELPGHPIELLLAIVKLLGIQEDINYWGTNPKTKKPYEGREKPYNALYNLFVRKEVKESLKTIMRKHQLR